MSVLKDGKPLVSVIVPVYNAEFATEDLEQCLESLRMQTLDSLEIIVVIDGPGNEIRESARKGQKLDPRIVIIENEKNRGPSDARNDALKAATGKYVGFVDHDDVADPRMFDALACMMEEDCGREIDIVICPFWKKVRGRKRRRCVSVLDRLFFKAKKGMFFISTADELGRILLNNTDFIWNKLYKREIVEEYSIRFPCGGHYNEDSVFVIEYLSHVRGAFFPNVCLYTHIESEGSVSKTGKYMYETAKHMKDAVDYLIAECDGDSGRSWDVLKPYLRKLFSVHYRRSLAKIGPAGDTEDFSEEFERLFFGYFGKCDIRWLGLRVSVARKLWECVARPWVRG